MTTKTKGQHTAEFIVSEANKTLSREPVTVLSGESVVAGEVVGVVTASGKYVAVDPAAVDGSEAAAGVMYGAVDASAADATGVIIARNAELNAGEIVWPSGISAPNQATATAELAALQIVLR